MVTLNKITTDSEVVNLASLATTIWHEFFVSILSDDQITYMVDKFLSYNAIKKQQLEGYEYYYIMLGTDILGFTGFHIEDEKMFLSKLYLLKQYRGHGYASQAFDYLKQICQRQTLKSMWLTVNKYNKHAIEVYQKTGFTIIRSQVTDIGNNYVMDDYVMEHMF